MKKEDEWAFEQNLNYAISTFDWEKVNDVMKYLDWDWYSLEGTHVPTIDEMIQHVRNLFYSCFQELCHSGQDTLSFASGGFDVTLTKEGHRIEILFVIANRLINDYSVQLETTIQ